MNKSWRFDDVTALPQRVVLTLYGLLAIQLRVAI